MSVIPRISKLELGEGVTWAGPKHLGEHNVVDSTTGPVIVSVDGASDEYQHRIVYKKAVKHSALTNPERQVRLFRQLNPGKFCALYQDGWVAEYVEGRQAADDEIAGALIDLCREHRRILCNAHVEGNVLVGEDGTHVTNVDYALRRDSMASQAVVFGSAYKLNPHMENISNTLYLHRTGVLAERDEQNWYVQSLGVTLGLLYLQRCLPAEEIDDEYIKENVITAVRMAYQLKMKVSVNLLEALVYLDKLGRLAALLQDDDQLRRLLHQDQVGDKEALVPDSTFLGRVDVASAKKQAPIDCDEWLRPAGLVLGLDCSDIAGKLDDSGQVGKLSALAAHVDAVKMAKEELAVTPELKKALNVDRTAGSRAARVIGMILTNAALVLLCLIGAGAAVFCWQRRRTGHSCWLFTETKTLEKLRIAQTAITRAAARVA
jgi:hypothetical protein